jgi:hypothetical protein
MDRSRDRITKRYSSRSEYDLDVQLMRASGYVVASIEDVNTAFNALPGSMRDDLEGPVKFLKRAPETIDDFRSSTKIVVTYRRAG